MSLTSPLAPEGFRVMVGSRLLYKGSHPSCGLAGEGCWGGSWERLPGPPRGLGCGLSCQRWEGPPHWTRQELCSWGPRPEVALGTGTGPVLASAGSVQ